MTIKKSIMQIVEEKYNNKSNSSTLEIKTGDLIQIGYRIPEGDKERIQTYEGLVISKKNKNLGKSFTIRRTVQGIGVEQIFFLNSPKIASIVKKQSSKIRRSKLYFLRNLKGKEARLKAIK